MTVLRKLITVAVVSAATALAGATVASAESYATDPPDVVPVTQEFGGMGSGPTQEAALSAAIAEADAQAAAAGFTYDDCSMLQDGIITGGVRPGFPVLYHALVTLSCLG
ncbi:hypothetical protein [Nonomuraea zeae]|uniref:DUF732 domain-containing protein n=1 Tax=Nonomuraea zeae TaxID=1642303 RepID=A0A5S4GN21_9ACTN|nr:hypothetical protein [Nonomuraea zeae]TMR33971.1 hypothetical protein ETD85_18300 [Nonomuraea zeae]